MTRFAALAHGVLGALVLCLPLMRLGWDQWAQTTVHLIWSFFLILGSVLLLFGRTGSFSQFHLVFPRWRTLWLVVLGTSLLSSLFSPFPHSAFPAFLNDLPAFAFFFLGAGSSEKRRFFYTRALVGAGVLGVGIALLLRGSFAAPLLNPNLLAALVLLTGPLALVYGFRADLSRGERWFWASASGVLLLGLFLSHSLAAYGTVLLQLLLAAGFLFKRNPRHGKVTTFILAGIGILMIVGLFWGRSEWGKLFHGDPDRWTWGVTALRAFTAHPVWGVGPGAFGEAYPAYRASEWGLNSLYAHNFLLEFLAERGLLGAGALFLLLGSVLVRAGRSAGEGRRVGFVLGMVGFCFFNLFHIGFSFPALYWLFFLAAGLAGPEVTGGRDNSEVHAWSRKRPLLSGSLGLLLGLASFALFRADQCLARARFFMSGERWDRVQDQVTRGLFWNRWSPSLYELRATLRIKSQNWDGAKEDLVRAVTLAPAASGFRVELAELLIEGGDMDRALKEYEHATRLMPLTPAPWERWGDLLSGQGRKDDADRAYAGALRALSDPRVLGGDGARRAAWSARVTEKRKLNGAERKS